MVRVTIFMVLFFAYLIYSFIVYTKGTETHISYTEPEKKLIDEGKQIFQQYNCISCHQIYGLGGYLGPELTTAWSDPRRGEAYMKAFLKYGGNRMPNYHFTENDIQAILSYLKYVDTTAVTYKNR